jgi:hypothetical protein
VSELLHAIRAGGDIDVIRKGVELVLQALIESEATEAIGAGRYWGRRVAGVAGALTLRSMAVQEFGNSPPEPRSLRIRT